MNDLKNFSSEIKEFLKKMQNMDNSDELALSQQLISEDYTDSDFFVMTQQTPNDYVKGWDPKQLHLSEDILADFVDVFELLGDQERTMFEEYRKAETLLDERYILKTRQLQEVYYKLKYQ